MPATEKQRKAPTVCDCDAQLRKISVTLREEADAIKRQRSMNAANAWLDNRLEAMRGLGGHGPG